jgi:PKD repeat protein
MLLPLVALMGMAACNGGGGDGGGGDSAPIAVIAAPSSDLHLATGAAVSFSASCVDVDGGGLTHEWSFEGGSPAASTDAMPPAVTFASSGTYQVTYVCRDSDGHASNVVAWTLSVASPAQLQAVSVGEQEGHAGEGVSDPPAVLVLDDQGFPLAGARVTFTVTLGGGAISGGDATTVEGLGAQLESWVLGQGDAQEVEAAAEGLANPVIFTAALASGSSAYHVDLRFLTLPSDAQRQAFVDAAARISEVIIADLPDLDETLPAYPECGLEEPVLPPVDDLLVVVDIGYIDGAGDDEGNVLGQAGPCYRRSTGKLPLVGIMQFDEYDLAALEASGELGAVILHEMLHVVGFGTLWPTFGRIRGAGGDNPYFDGSRARAAFADYNGGSAYSGTPVPVENTGGEGTADVHWRETVFENELMTGWLSGSTQPLSRTTVESLADMGYGVNALMADPFDLSTAALLAQGAAGEVLFLGNDVLPIAPRDH